MGGIQKILSEVLVQSKITQL